MFSWATNAGRLQYLSVVSSSHNYTKGTTEDGWYLGWAHVCGSRGDSGEELNITKLQN